MEQSDLGPYCLQYRLPKHTSRTEKTIFFVNGGKKIKSIHYEAFMPELYSIANFIMEANTMNPDQTAPVGAV